MWPTPHAQLLFQLAAGTTPFGLIDTDDMLLLKRVIQHQSGGLEVPSYLSETFGQFVDALLHPTVSMRLGSQGTDEVSARSGGPPA